MRCAKPGHVLDCPELGTNILHFLGHMQMLLLVAMHMENAWLVPKRPSFGGFTGLMIGLISNTIGAWRALRPPPPPSAASFRWLGTLTLKDKERTPVHYV